MVADMHDSLLFFTERGRVFQLKAHEIPDATRQAKGIPLINLIDIDQDELITAVVAVTSFDQDSMLLATKMGEIKRTPLSEFASVRRNGLIAMNLEPGDELIAAKLARADDDVLFDNAPGIANRFAVKYAAGGIQNERRRPRHSPGAGDQVVSMEVVSPLTANCSPSAPMAMASGRRSGSTAPTRVAAVAWRTSRLPTRPDRLSRARRQRHPRADDHFHDGVVLRTTVDSIRITGRSAQGVHIMNIGPHDSVAAIAGIEEHEEEQPPASPPARRTRRNQPE